MAQRFSLPWAWPYLACAALAVGAASGVASARPEFFRPYLADVGVAVTVGVLAFVGLVAIAALRVNGAFFSSWKLSRRALMRGGLVVAAFALSAIVADAALRFPHDINVPVPWALLFYPAIAFVVEVAFHVIPLALALTVFRAQSLALVIACAIAVALIEPLFQGAGRARRRQFRTDRFFHLCAGVCVQLVRASCV